MLCGLGWEVPGSRDRQSFKKEGTENKEQKISFMHSLWSVKLGWFSSGKGIVPNANLKVENYFLYAVDSSKLCSSFEPPPPRPAFIQSFFFFPYILSFSVFFLVSISFRMFEQIKLGEVFGTSSLLFTVLSGSYIRISYCSIKCSNKNFASTSEINLKTDLETE